MGQRLPRLRQGVARLIKTGPCREPLPEQLLLAGEVLLREGDILGRAFDADILGGEPGAQLGYVQPGGRQRRFGLRKRDTVGCLFNFEKQRTLCHLLVFGHGDLRNPPADIGTDRDFVLPDIGIVGGHRPGPGQIVPGGQRDQDQRQADHQQQP